MSETIWCNFANILDGRLTWRGALRFLSICAVLLTLSFCGIAQTSSSISGTVKDVTGAILPGAKVVLTNENNKSTRSSKSNGEGFFYIAGVPAGTYDVSISFKGFENWTVTGIEVHPGDNLTVPKISLQAGSVTESVVVSAEVAGVALDSGEHSTLITSAQINRLSTVGRDSAELISILPGFAVSTGLDNSGVNYQQAGFGSSNISSYGANGSMPKSGSVNVSSDGASLIDPGDMGGQISNVNMDQVQEVKVQTSNFAADQAKGPVVIDAIGKSGGSDYRGSLYSYLRNYDFNSNSWVSKHVGLARPEEKYFYPGGSIGGPVRIPGTQFNRNKRLTFWAGYEYYGQKVYQGQNQTFVPTPAMMQGDLSLPTIAKALNVDQTALLANCSGPGSVSEAYSNLGGVCVSPGWGVTTASSAPKDENDNAILNGKIPTADIDPGIGAYSSFWPKANHTPHATASGLASEGFNYVENVMGTSNGYQFHSRVDLSITENLKLYGTYNWEKVNYVQKGSSSYDYSTGGNIDMPTAFDSNSGAHYLTTNLTKTFGASSTNELIASVVYFTEPAQYENRSKLEDTGTAWASAGYGGGASGQAMYGIGSKQGKVGENQLPHLGSWEGASIPTLDAAYVSPNKGQFINKYTGSVADNLTKVYRTHSFKAGIYTELVANNGANLGSNLNGTMQFMRWGSCFVNQPLTSHLPPASTSSEPDSFGASNEIGNFLTGCPLYYSQDLSDPSQNLRYKSIEGYVTDEWKINSKLTVTAGIRLSHIGPWIDRHGLGAAVWEPSELTKGVYLDSVAQDPKTWKGFKWHAEDRSIPVAGVPTRALFYSPRFSLAYDLYGNGKTVFRGGWGTYYYHDNVGYGGGALQTSQGKESWSITNAGTGCSYAQLFSASVIPCGYYTRSGVGGQLPAFSVNALDPHDDKLPTTYNYNFTLDQSLPSKLMLELAYVGNQSTNMTTGSGTANQNVIPLGAFFGPDPVTQKVNPISSIPNTNDYRPYPNYSQVNVPTHKGWANYNSMQASLNKQTGSLIYGVNYTWAKSLAVRDGGFAGQVGDPLNLQNDYGPSAIDRRQVLNATYSWQEGSKFHGNHIVGAVANGWEVSGITTLQDGPDIAVLTNTNFNLSGGADYYYTANGTTTQESVQISNNTWLGTSDYNLQPTVTCDPRQGLKKNQFINGNCFGLPAQGTEGVFKLPYVPGPKYFKWDMSVYKDFKISDRQNMQFRLSGFNFLNHPITSFNTQYDTSSPLTLLVGDPSTSHYTSLQQALSNAKVVNPNIFGSTTFKAGQRIVELGFKYNF